jgi:hypothetical protein
MDAMDASGNVYIYNSGSESGSDSGSESGSDRYSDSKEGYDFKNYYVDSYSCYLNDEDYTNKILYEGTSSYIILLHNLIIYTRNANNQCETKYKKIYYKIKNNLSNKITLKDAFKQLDEQSKEYVEQYLQYDDHHFIESIDKINDITFELVCCS